MAKRPCEYESSFTRDHETKKHITEKEITYVLPDKSKSLCDKNVQTFKPFDGDGSRPSTEGVQVIPAKICKQCHTMTLADLMCGKCFCYICDRCGKFCTSCQAYFCPKCF